MPMLSRAAALLAAVLLPWPVVAAEKTCQDFVEIVGPAAALRSAAPKKARKRWVEEVTKKLGAEWANWDLADTKDDRFNCGYTSGVLWNCGARARPCMMPAEPAKPITADGKPTAAGSAAVAATISTCAALPKRKAKCDDRVLAIQTRLNAEGCSAGEADGVKGAATGKALRCFQKKKGLSESGTADTATMAALGLK